MRGKIVVFMAVVASLILLVFLYPRFQHQHAAPPVESPSIGPRSTAPPLQPAQVTPPSGNSSIEPGSIVPIWGPRDEDYWDLIPTEMGLEAWRRHGGVLPTYVPEGLRFLGVACYYGMEGARQGALDDPELIALEYALEGKNVSVHGKVSRLLPGPDVVVRMDWGRLVRRGNVTLVRGCPMKVGSPGEGVDYWTRRWTTLPAVVTFEVGNLTYTIWGLLPTGELVRMAESMIPESGCRPEDVRPEVRRVSGRVIPIQEVSDVFGLNLSLPKVLLDGLELRLAVQDTLAGESLREVTLFYCDHECGPYSPPAPWDPRAPNLTVLIDTLPVNATAMEWFQYSVEVDGVKVYVWPEGAYLPNGVTFWFGGLHYEIQGYYPIKDLLEVAREIIALGSTAPPGE